MRPDLDEYEELNPESGEPRSRAMSWLVLGVAVVGFGALAYYAYQSGSQSVADGQMLVVDAEDGPIKEAPANAGGEQFPHKDKTIYDALSPYRTDQKVETLLPAAEEPVIPEPAVGAEVPAEKEKSTAATTSYVNDNNKVAASEDDEGDATPVAKTEPAPAAKPVEPAKPAAPAKLETVEVNDSSVATKPVAKPVETPKPVAKPVEAPKPVAKPAPTPAPKPAPAPAAASGGDYKIQLGALSSEAEARTLWSKITAKHGDVVKGSPIIVKAEVNGKTYYRLRASGFASADAAKKACATLSGRGQACMPAGK